MNTTKKIHLDSPLILIIDDEMAILKTLQTVLEDEEYHVKTLNDGNKAIDFIGKLIPDLVLLDICMPNCNGIKLLKQIKKEYPHQKVIMISGYGNISVAIEALKNGALDFIEKPFNLDEILEKIEFLKQENLRAPQKIISEGFDEIIGESTLFLELMSQAKKLATYHLTIIIYGEHGTGKKSLAKFIHKNSKIAQYKLITINCNNLKNPDDITTNFSCDTPQTILIDHIETLSLKAQKSLLRKIESVNHETCRLIVSSCTQLFDLVKNKKFNADLFYKLNIAPLEIPSLRKRPHDIPLLTDSFITNINKKLDSSAVLTTKSMRLLRNHQWPGNITELKNTIYKVVSCINKKDTIITPQHLEKILGEKNIPIIEEQSFTRFNSLEEATTTFEQKFISSLLKQHLYNIEQVSRHLEITQLQLKNKIIELDIKIPKKELVSL
jgi:two-component system, NtrC family, nitrogen regulation response regulator NtrX